MEQTQPLPEAAQSGAELLLKTFAHLAVAKSVAKAVASFASRGQDVSHMEVFKSIPDMLHRAISEFEARGETAKMSDLVSFSCRCRWLELSQAEGAQLLRVASVEAYQDQPESFTQKIHAVLSGEGFQRQTPQDETSEPAILETRWTHGAEFQGFKADLVRVDLPDRLQKSSAWTDLVASFERVATGAVGVGVSSGASASSGGKRSKLPDATTFEAAVRSTSSR
eukprot:SAG31_NODE_99_length_25388_cov_12.710507_19_plen_224_part_00